MNKTFFTVKDVARMLKLNTLTVYGYIKGAKLQAVKLGRNYRIEEKDLNIFIQKSKL